MTKIEITPEWISTQREFLARKMRGSESDFLAALDELERLRNCYHDLQDGCGKMYAELSEAREEIERLKNTCLPHGNDDDRVVPNTGGILICGRCGDKY